MEKNRELNELLGLCWHSPATPAMSHVGGSVCKKCKQRFDANPEYADLMDAAIEWLRKEATNEPT